MTPHPDQVHTILAQLRAHPRSVMHGHMSSFSQIEKALRKGQKHIIELRQDDIWRHKNYVFEIYGKDSCSYLGSGLYLFKDLELATMVKLERG